MAPPRSNTPSNSPTKPPPRRTRILHRALQHTTRHPRHLQTLRARCLPAGQVGRQSLSVSTKAGATPRARIRSRRGKLGSIEVELSPPPTETTPTPHRANPAHPVRLREATQAHRLIPKPSGFPPDPGNGPPEGGGGSGGGGPSGENRSFSWPRRTCPEPEPPTYESTCGWTCVRVRMVEGSENLIGLHVIAAPVVFIVGNGERQSLKMVRRSISIQLLGRERLMVSNTGGQLHIIHIN